MSDITDSELQNRLIERAAKLEAIKNSTIKKLEDLGFTHEEIALIIGSV